MLPRASLVLPALWPETGNMRDLMAQGKDLVVIPLMTTEGSATQDNAGVIDQAPGQLS